MSSWLTHLPVLPVVIPLIAGAAMLSFVEAQRRSGPSLPLPPPYQI